MATSALALAGFAAATLALTTLTVHRRRGWTMTRLHPVLDA